MPQLHSHRMQAVDFHSDIVSLQVGALAGDRANKLG
jgi:hypothetical protein